ncbi:Wadjet anti-phage system protein JetD domain-containing protein [Brachybacterium sp. Marseille-Q7125]|uniref:Wadjet anti-phage system protein JetD domain-containing protein n=1 Tax=Brachybacterium sp. Marseille-Q7125 TaxID=2932815 RepID=UPI001FF1217C
MRSVQEVRDLLRTRWERSMAAWLADPSAAAVSLPLHPPTQPQVLADPAAVQRWVEQWSSAPAVLRDAVIWRRVAWAHLGAQELPHRWEIAGAEQLTRAAGPAVHEQFTQFSHWVQRALVLLTGASDRPAGELREALARAIVAQRSRWLGMGRVDAELCLRAAVWVLAHPASGLRIRQVPLPGMHTKWLQAHRAVVRALVAAAQGEATAVDQDLGLAAEPSFHDVLVLDPALRGAASGPRMPRASRVDAAFLAELELSPRIVLICENSETVQVLPDLPGTVALSGAGYAVASVLEVPWVQRAPVLYWGDLDADGFRILHRARAHHPAVTSILMDAETFARYAELAVTSPPPPMAELPSLTEGEQEMYQRLQADGLRLEQERIELSYAVETLRESLASRGPHAVADVGISSPSRTAR